VVVAARYKGLTPFFFISLAPVGSYKQSEDLRTEIIHLLKLFKGVHERASRGYSPSKIIINFRNRTFEVGDF
jgi:hypothetical protein